jgi:hypothetical protein
VGARAHDKVATAGENLLMKPPALVLAALAAFLAACGGSSEATPTTTVVQQLESSAQQAVLQAGAKTQAAKSGRIALMAEIAGGAANGSMSGEGAFAGPRGRMSMDLSGLGNGEVTGRLELAFDRLLIYMKFPPEVARELPGGKTWVKFDLARLGKQEGIDFEELMQLGGSDPSRSLDLLRAASHDFAAVGDEAVRGVQTTHYRGTIDLEKLAQQGPAKARESYRRIIEETGQKQIPVDVWIDEDGLTRRLHYEQKMPGGGSTDFTQEFYDFGADVNVEAPPASQTIDITELVAGA